MQAPQGAKRPRSAASPGSRERRGLSGPRNPLSEHYREGRRKINQPTIRPASTVRDPQRRINDRNPTLTEPVWKCDTSRHPATAGETGVVGRSGAADPHGRTERSGINSSRPISGRSRGIKFACDGTARFGTCGQDGEAKGLVPAVLHPAVRRPVSSTPVTASRAPKPPKAKPKTKTAGSTAATAARGGDVPWTTAKPTATRSAP